MRLNFITTKNNIDKIQHMVKIILFAIFTILACSDILYCQTDFPTINGTWCYNQYGDTGENLGDICISPVEIIDVNGKSYSKIDYPKQPSSPYQELLYREENQKFYVLPKDSINEILVYDFNLEVGDIFKTNWGWNLTDSISMVIQRIDTVITLDGVSRRKFILDHYNYPGSGTYHQGEWIEGIGSLDWIFVFPSYTLSTSGGFSFICHWVDSNLVYPYFDNFPECELIDNLNNNQLDFNFSFFPNPFINQLNIEFNHLNVKEVKVINQMGQVVFKQSENFGKDITIYTDNINPGIYFLQIALPHGLVINKKCIKI